MNNRITQIALKISIIKEEYPEADIFEAVKLLEGHGSSSALLDYLANRKVTNGGTRGKTPGRKNKSIDEQRSKAVLELEDKDPAKFQILSEFDVLVRKCTILPELDDIKRLGERLSKDFKPKNSRKEAISKLMTLLAKLPLEEIKEILRLTRSSNNDRSTEYHDLAQFLITGKSSQTRRA